MTWKNDFRYDTLQHYTFRTALRASIRLPRMTRKLRLVIAGENQGDPTASQNPETASGTDDRNRGQDAEEHPAGQRRLNEIQIRQRCRRSIP